MFGRKKNTPHARKSQNGRKASGSRSTLWIVALLFMLSGAIRVGDYGVAIAKEVSALAQGDVIQPHENGVCETEADIALVLTALEARERTIEDREAALENRLQALTIAEQQIQKNMSALVEAENALKATMALADGAAEKDLTQLTQVYESMKAKQAIPLFAQMDPQFAAGFLGRMRSDAAAQIMAGLDPQKSYAISVILAGRNANVPTN